MKPTVETSWIFSRLMGKGFIRLQLYDRRTHTSFFCAEIEEYPTGDRDFYGFDHP